MPKLTRVTRASHPLPGIERRGRRGAIYSASMRAPIRPIRGRWPAGLEHRADRFFWADPQVIVDGSATPDLFRTAMSAINVGETIKITGSNRHPGADQLLLDHVDLTDAAIVDIGASDGSTSVDLIDRIGQFGSYTIADLYLTLEAVQVGSHTLLFDHSGECILVIGRRGLAWPSLSRPVATLYAPIIARAAGRTRAEVLLLNPAARDLIATDPRVGYRVHDVFTPWEGDPPDVIKVANLLRRLYFPDEQITVGLRALLTSLPEGGHLLMVDNPRIEGIDYRAGLFRRSGGRFELVATTEQPPEIGDLIEQVRL